MLQLHVFCGYPSYEESGAAWRTVDYKGRNFIKALKGQPFNGYSEFNIRGGRVARLSEKTPGVAFDLFGPWAARVIRQAGIGDAILVPVPGSACVEFGTDEKGERICAAIVKHHPGLRVQQALCWNGPIDPAHLGGPRDAQVLFQRLEVRDDLPLDTPIILVDDVATSHGHMKAAASKLRSRGAAVALAIAAAQTVNEHPPHGMFAFPTVDLDAD